MAVRNFIRLDLLVGLFAFRPGADFALALWHEVAISYSRK